MSRASVPAVPSGEPSSITTTSKASRGTIWRSRARTTKGSVSALPYVGITTLRSGARSVACSDMGSILASVDRGGGIC